MPSVPVHVGYWRDYTQNSALGKTVTLDARSSSYLIAALSTFIGIVGSATWVTTAFIVHQLQARGGRDDGVYFQHQIIYRNQGTPLGALFDVWGVGWSWRAKTEAGKRYRRVRRLKARTFWRSVPPLLVFVGFTAAGIFVGEIAAPGYVSNNVLVQHGRCGYWAFETESQNGLFAESYKSVNDTLAARQYARSCYAAANDTLQDCGLYPVRRVAYNASMVGCPFLDDPNGDTLCLPAGNQALQMDTGYMDTSQTFGINTALANRILLRRVVTCAPIRTDAYLDTSSTDASGYTLWQFNMGPVRNATTYTYLYNTHTVSDLVSYSVLPVIAFDGNQAWEPVMALNIPNADISAFFLAQNTVSYSSPVQDIWFAATNFSDGSGLGISLGTYRPDKRVTVMACTEQYQICNPTSSPHTCSILGSLMDVDLSTSLLGLNPHQLATAQRLIRVLQWTTSFQIAFDLGAKALLAADLVRVILSPGLPDQQWKLEATGWFEAGNAKLQDYVVQFAVNAADLGPYGFVIAPNPQGDPTQKALSQACSNQRVRNTGQFRSFSFVGLMIVVCLGSALLVLSWTLEYIVGKVRGCRTSRKHDDREVGRIADHKLQLHRMALVGAGYRDIWERTLESVPVTRADIDLPAASRVDDTKDADYRYSPAGVDALSPPAKPVETEAQVQVPKTPAAPETSVVAETNGQPAREP